ncbi:MAG: hypothetical protein JSR82_04475 [Verrucomicrobia bacterium]|nr:hypothetical protein [Verrucomicrobiota bacterium]
MNTMTDLSAAVGKLEKIAHDLSEAVPWQQMRDRAREQVLEPLQQQAGSLQRRAGEFADDVRSRFSDPETRPAAVRETLLYLVGAAAIYAGIRLLRRSH